MQDMWNLSKVHVLQQLLFSTVDEYYFFVLKFVLVDYCIVNGPLPHQIQLAVQIH